MELDDTPCPHGKRKRDRLDDTEDVDIQSEHSNSDLFVANRSDDGIEDVQDDGFNETSEGEDSLGDMDNECEYDEGGEPWPACVAFDLDFANLKEHLSQISNTAMKIVDDSGCQSQRALSLRKNACQGTNVPRSNREKVALLGNTGAGKSSLLNSLLDRPDLARAVIQNIPRIA